jgi:hypothetical protein
VDRSLRNETIDIARSSDNEDDTTNNSGVKNTDGDNGYNMRLNIIGRKI